MTRGAWLVALSLVGCGGASPSAAGPSAGATASTAAPTVAAPTASASATATVAATSQPTAAADTTCAKGYTCEIVAITDAIKANLEARGPKPDVEIRFASGATNADLATIAKVPWARRVSIRSEAINDLSPLANLPELEALDCWSAKDVSSVAPLAKSAALKELSLHMTKVADIKPLAGLTKLERLSLYATPVTELGPLAGLKSLKNLNLYMVKAADYAPLQGLTELEELSLQFSALKDLKVLGAMTKLQILRLAWSKELADVSALANLPELGELELDDCPVKSIAALAKLAKLRRVSLSGTQVKELAPLTASAKSLQSLTLPKGTRETAYAPLKKDHESLSVRVDE